MRKIVKLLFTSIFVMLTLAGCVEKTDIESKSKNEETIIEDSRNNSQDDLMVYLGAEIEAANEQIALEGYSSITNSFEDSNYRNIHIYRGEEDNHLAIMHSQQGKYIDQISINNDSGQFFSIMGIHTGMTAREALEILKESNYVFRTIQDSTDEEKGDYQTVSYIKNGVYQISFDIYGGGAINPYGSLDESDIHADGTVEYIDCQCIIVDKFEELANDVGDWSGHGGTTIVESINDECTKLTAFIENNSFNVPGVDTYGTYVFGDDVITIDLQPGAGDWEYITRVSIGDVCPYKLYGIYYGMEKEMVLAHMDELETTVQKEEKDKIVYDIDSYTTLEIHFNDGQVCFIECIDDYPEEHEKRRIEE